MEEYQEFDMEKYIKKRMLEITSLEDRRLYKEIVEKLLLDIYKYNKKSFDDLEQRILNEHKSQQNDFAVYLTLTDRKHYDATDTFMYPMIEDDVKEREYHSKEILDGLKKGDKVKIDTIFLQASVSVINKLLEEKRTFQGVIHTTKGEHKGTFELVRNEQYMELVKDLYYIFGVNYQRWMTVCEAYITKMFDVYLCSMEKLPDKEEIVDVNIDFEELSELVYYDMIPLWNLEKKIEKTSTYPEPCIDKINYEHRIFAHRLKEECEYLIINTDVEITNIRRFNGDLIITCPLDNPCEWKLYQVNKRTGKEYYLYQVLSNQSKESFAGSLAQMYQRSVKTKAEIARMIESFSYDNYVIFKDLEIMDTCPEELKLCNYNMDGFILDEIRIGNSQQVLVLNFAAVEPNHYLNEDIMSFLVTHVQKIFPEYICMGRLL